MKKIFKFTSAGVFALALTACSNALDQPVYQAPNQSPDGITLSMAKAPEVVAWSGEQALGINPRSVATRAADVNGNLWYQSWQRPTNVTIEEIEKVLAEASKKRIGEKNSIHIDWTNYWVQQVYTGEQTYIDGFGQNIGTGSSHMNQLLAYSSKENKVVSWWDESVGGPVYELVDKTDGFYEHVNNFNSGSNATIYTDDETSQSYVGTTLMTDMYAEGIVDQFAYHNTVDSKVHYEYIILEVDGSYYVCFDFYAVHPEGQDANKNMDVERDWIFNDWIVKISPAYRINETPGLNPNPDPTDPNPNPTPNPGGGENEGGSNNPGQPVVHDNEVEVNLSINDIHTQYDIADLVTKLSIHVRKGTDVRIRIPVDAAYVIDTDDMAIFQQHVDTNTITYGGPVQTVYSINGSSVTLNVSFDAGGINVWTDGITQGIIDYCMATYGDGLNFEVYNYFNKGNMTLEWGGKPTDYPALTKDQLKGYLDQSTIEFLDGSPDYYINAFGWEYYDDYDYVEGDGGHHKDTINPYDCTVRPAQSQGYNGFITTSHLNGTPFNNIYVLSGVTADDGHIAH